MARLSSSTRQRMPKKDFAGADKSFPVNDARHARLAIAGATRSERAGNISAATAKTIKAKAHAKLGNEKRKIAEDEASGRAPAKRATRKDDTPDHTVSMGKPGHVTYR